MKTFQWFSESEEEIRIDYDYDMNGNIEVIQGEQGIQIPGAAVRAFISAYLEDKKICKFEIEPP